MFKKQKTAACSADRSEGVSKSSLNLVFAIGAGIALAIALHSGLSGQVGNDLQARLNGLTTTSAAPSELVTVSAMPRAKPKAGNAAPSILPVLEPARQPDSPVETVQAAQTTAKPIVLPSPTDAQRAAALQSLNTELALKHLTRHLQAQAIVTAEMALAQAEAQRPDPLAEPLASEAVAASSVQPENAEPPVASNAPGSLFAAAATATVPQALPLIDAQPQDSLTVASVSPAAIPVPQIRPRPLVRTPPASAQLAYAAAGDPAGENGRYSGFGKLLNGNTRLPGPRSKIAVYDISAATVYMPDGTELRAHSGIGHRMDNPKYAYVKNLGPTPPNIYNLRMRERRFHGVEAIRMLPVDRAAMKGRDGMLAHTPLLRRTKGSHGCVAFQDYNKFLRAFKAGKVKTMIVVPSIEKLPTYMAKFEDSKAG